ncbi:hypothetical protein HK103_006777 [Boothiomyces macroporosus]|uniref:Extradiol ring-cleavage dioxygenase class III enzyme subunit B domain-containing protein n=1 Tax=Boothiomyces macroporosus TaxID=261099 RepID=A0AAD5Y2B8_9FUNG|nr:hypothetical protein HK103_006777 [Boothiomyces macroporosus]
MAKSIFLPHGGGPMPLLGAPSHKELIAFLNGKAKDWIGKPKAIIVVTAHWETKNPIISGASKHELYYDYYNFPPEAYQVKYDAPGSPEIAKKVFELLSNAGFHPEIDTKRGWDHGVFIPLKMVVPEANIPIVQVSVLESQDAVELLNMGKALAPLLKEDVAIIGSGFSFHHFGAFRNSPEAAADGNKAFETQLLQVAKLPPKERFDALSKWKEFKGAEHCHPVNATEHFSPLLVTAGAGESLEDHVKLDALGVETSGYVWN